MGLAATLVAGSPATLSSAFRSGAASAAGSSGGAPSTPAASSTSASAAVMRNAGDNGLVTVPPRLVIIAEPLVEGDERPNEPVSPLRLRGVGVMRGKYGADVGDILESDTLTESTPRVLEELHRFLVRVVEVDVFHGFRPAT